MRRNVLMLGNFLSATRVHRHYCEDLAERLEASGWYVTRASTRPGRLARLADMAMTVWRCRHDYDVAHIDLYSGLAFSWAELMSLELSRLGKPVVITLHGGSLPAFAKRWPRRVRRMLSRAVSVTSPSRYLGDAMRMYASGVTVIPNGLDVSRYALRAREHAAGRLIWVRAFHRVYNPVMAVDVLAELCARGRDVTLRMIGPDRHDGSLEAVRARASQTGVTGRLDIVGPVPNALIARELDRADIFLNTSNADNTPVSVLEAMATGLCVVSTAVGGIPYLLEDRRNALLVPAGDSHAAARAVERVLAEPALAHDMSLAARAAVTSYDWPVVVQQWNRLLEMAVGRA